MGFRSGVYATVWEVTPVSNVNTKGRISISRKDKNTGEYRNEFSDFVSFLGADTASRALKLQHKDRIRLGDVDVTTRYDKERNIKWYNFNIFSFENADSFGEQGGNSVQTQSQPTVVESNPYDGEPPIEEDLPF